MKQIIDLLKGIKKDLDIIASDKEDFSKSAQRLHKAIDLLNENR